MGEYASMLNKRVNTWGATTGYCAICRSFGQLTQDHVPPKGCGNVKDVTLQTLLQHMVRSKIKRHSQHGVQFRTLCSNCNNNLLGARYDPELIRLYNSVSELGDKVRQNKTYLPRNFFCEIKPQRLVRAVVGHLLAAHSINFLSNGDKLPPFYDSLSKYFLGESEHFPENIEIYYWFYPYRSYKVAKSTAVASLSWSGYLFGDVIKFFPVAFWLVMDKPAHINIPHNLLLVDKTMDIDSKVEFQLNLKNTPNVNYPEMPDKDGIILMSEDASSVGFQK
ncbi:hypothetical protein [Cellvibrio sp. UBA7661]|uniref:hypothetical protein n=1 Tax=Cellvibrio sp. UBA7661 TaxID=1946311 RepID=UPI002F34F439